MAELWEDRFRIRHASPCLAKFSPMSEKRLQSERAYTSRPSQANIIGFHKVPGRIKIL